MILKKLINNYHKKQTIKKVLNKVTLAGNIPEITGATTVRLKYGSSKKNVIVKNDVSLLGCTIVSLCGGKVLLGDYDRYQDTVVWRNVDESPEDEKPIMIDIQVKIIFE